MSFYLRGKKRKDEVLLSPDKEKKKRDKAPSSSGLVRLLLLCPNGDLSFFSTCQASPPLLFLVTRVALPLLARPSTRLEKFLLDLSETVLLFGGSIVLSV